MNKKKIVINSLASATILGAIASVSMATTPVYADTTGEQIGQVLQAAQVRLNVTDELARPIPNAEVEVALDGDYSKVSTYQADASGVLELTVLDGQSVHARIANLPEGYDYKRVNGNMVDFEVKLFGNSAHTETRTLSLDKVETSVVPQTAQVRIRVIDAALNRPLEDVEIDFLVDGKAMTIKTDVDGNADITVLAGQTIRYRIAMVAIGYENPGEGSFVAKGGLNLYELYVKQTKVKPNTSENPEGPKTPEVKPENGLNKPSINGTSSLPKTKPGVHSDKSNEVVDSSEAEKQEKLQQNAATAKKETTLPNTGTAEINSAFVYSATALGIAALLGMSKRKSEDVE